jgi:hypothetical protein
MDDEGTSTGASPRSADPQPSPADELVAAVRRLERFAAEESARISHSVLPRLEAKARDNLWTSLLLAVVLGLILGVRLSAGRRRG